MIPRFATVRRMITLSAVVSLITLTSSANPPGRIVRPVRQLELVTGERLNVEFLALDEQGCEFRWHGHTHCRLPLAAIRTLSNPPGVIDQWDESGESFRRDGQDKTTAAWHRTVATPLAAGELTVWYRPRESKNSTVEFHCGFRRGDQDDVLRLRIHSTGQVEVTPPAGWRRQFSQQLHPSHSWSRLAVHWNTQRCDVVVDDSLHSTYRNDAARFNGLAVSSTSDEVWCVELDHLTLREFNAELAARADVPREVLDQDAVTLTTGDQLFGRFARAPQTGAVALRSPHGGWSGRWQDIIQLDFARRPLHTLLVDPVDGWLFDVNTTAEGSTGHLAESLRAVRIDGRSITHPWLGNIVQSSLSIASFTPYGRGEFRWLEPDRQHLGDEIRPDLTPSRPVGTAIAGTVQLDSVPSTATWIVVDVAEVEPSGLHTLPTQPFLETLRGGGLRTELLLNDRLVTDLNRYVSLRQPPNHPERLWVRIPSDAWRVGKNIWTIRQRPLAPTQSQYDDAEIGRVGLWISNNPILSLDPSEGALVPWLIEELRTHDNS